MHTTYPYHSHVLILVPSRPVRTTVAGTHEPECPIPPPPPRPVLLAGQLASNMYVLSGRKRGRSRIWWEIWGGGVGNGERECHRVHVAIGNDPFDGRRSRPSYLSQRALRHADRDTPPAKLLPWTTSPLPLF